MTKIQCLIRENLDGIRDLITTREAGFAEIWAPIRLGKKMIFGKKEVQDAGFSWRARSRNVGSGPPPLPHPGLSRPVDDGYINDNRESKGDNDSYL